MPESRANAREGTGRRALVAEARFGVYPLERSPHDPPLPEKPMRPSSSFVASLLTLAISVALSPATALAAWQPGGTRVSPLPPQYDSYSLVAATADGAGGTILTWLHETNVTVADYLYERIETQRIDRDGNIAAGWPAAGRQLVGWNPMSFGPTFSAGVIGSFPDGAQGAFVVTLQQGIVGDFVNDVQVYHVSATGAVRALGASPFGLLNAQQAAVDADGTGGLVFASVGLGASSPPDPRPALPLVATRFDANGVSLWPEATLAPPGQAIESAGFAVAGDGTGGAFVAWVDNRNWVGGLQSRDVYVQRIRGDGTLDPAWPAGGVRTSGPLTEPTRPRLRVDGMGGVWVVWCEQGLVANTAAARVSHLAAEGSLVAGTPAEGRVLGEMNQFGDLFGAQGDGTGGLYLLRSTSGGRSTRQNVLHRLASDGQPQPGWPLDGLALDARPLGTYYSSGALAVDDAHGAFATYHVDPSPTGATAVVVRELDANGQPASGWPANGQALASSGIAYGFTAATRSDAGVIVAWNDARHADGGWGSTVYAQRVLTDGPVATTVSLLSAEVAADGVHLAWQVALDGATNLAVERGDLAGAWSEIARPAPGTDGRVTLTDAAAPAGTRVGYRLAWSAGGQRATSEPVWVEVPVAGALALAVGPNPANREGQVRFTLPHAGRAEVTVHDVTGRRVRRLASGTFAAGTHARTWDLRDDAGRSLGAGVYLVRIASDAGTITRKLALAP